MNYIDHLKIQGLLFIEMIEIIERNHKTIGISLLPRNHNCPSMTINNFTLIGKITGQAKLGFLENPINIVPHCYQIYM